MCYSRWNTPCNNKYNNALKAVHPTFTGILDTSYIDLDVSFSNYVSIIDI